MSALDDDIRLLIEKGIDEVLARPDLESEIQEYLLNMEIQPNLETTLGFTTGMLFGMAIGAVVITKGLEEMFTEEKSEISSYVGEAFFPAVIELLGRRTMELRQHLSRSKYM